MPKATGRSAKTIATILEAAGRVIRRLGSTGLTIDAVAAEAGLSKGGVLHHFASKDALIAGMVVHQLARLDREVTAIEADLPPTRVAPLLAMIRHARRHYGAEDGIPKALLVASAENPGALAGFRMRIAETLRALGRGAAEDAGTAEDVGATESRVLLFAVLGLLLTKSLGFYACDPAEIAGLLDALERMAGG